jgi:hypothetical protein
MISFLRPPFLVLGFLPTLLPQVPLWGQSTVRLQAHVWARILRPEDLPGCGLVQTLHLLEFGSIQCNGGGGVVTVGAGGTRSAQGAVTLGAGGAKGGASIVFQGPIGQGFNLDLKSGPILARNARGDALQVSDCRVQVNGNLLTLGASARISAGQPPGHYNGQCFLHFLLH